jgi:hypothetical protein
MKTQNNIFFTQLEKSEMADFTLEAKKETSLANSETILTAADLWKIHSMTRPRHIRKFLM